jgi:hypothetical protein
MGQFGTLNKKTIIHVLSSGCEYLNGCLEDGTIEKTDYNHYQDLKKVLYEEGQTLLSITNKVKFEHKINRIKKRMDKKFSTISEVKKVSTMKTYWDMIYNWDSKTSLKVLFEGYTTEQIEKYIIENLSLDLVPEEIKEIAEAVNEFINQ